MRNHFTWSKNEKVFIFMVSFFLNFIIIATFYSCTSCLNICISFECMYECDIKDLIRFGINYNKDRRNLGFSVLFFYWSVQPKFILHLKTYVYFLFSTCFFTKVMICFLIIILVTFITRLWVFVKHSPLRNSLNICNMKTHKNNTLIIQSTSGNNFKCLLQFQSLKVNIRKKIK